MNKNDVIGEAVAAIPNWLAFLEMKEQEQQAILAEIMQQADIGLPLGKEDLVEPVGGDETAVLAPLSWLDEDMPPPAGEPQQLPEEMALIVNDEDSTTANGAPPWASEADE